MAGFAALIGGMGQGAQQYGQQIRGLLEQRREHLAALLSEHVLPELGGDTRNQMIPLIAGLASGAPLGDTALKVTKILQAHQKDTAALNEAGNNLAALVGPQQGPAPNTAGPTPPGKPVGSGIPSGPDQNMTPVAGMSNLIAGGAAQPSASPVQPQSQQAPAQPQQRPQIQPMPPESGLPGMSMEDMQSKLAGVSPGMRSALGPELSNEAQLRRGIQTTNWTLNKANELYNDPNFLPQAQGMERTIAIASFLGKSPSIYGLSSISTPIDLTHRPGSTLPEGALDINDQPVEHSENALYTIQQNKLDPKKMRYVRESVPVGTGYNAEGHQILVPRVGTPGATTGAVAPMGTGINDQGQQVFQPKYGQVGAPTGNVNPTLTHPHYGVDSATGQESYTIPGVFGPPIPTNQTPIGLIPHAQDSLRSVSTTDANGNPTTELVPVRSTSSPVLPGAAKGGAAAPAGASALPPVGGTAAGGNRQFEKPFTPEQKMKGEQQLGQYNLAIDRMESLRKQVPVLLSSMLESGKLSLELDSTGLIKALVNRSMTMTPAESRFVGDFRTMMEDINLLRGPMGATGFRGPEAWAALQAQRGQLLAHPEVTEQVLDNSIRALKAQQGPLAQRFGPRGQQGGGQQGGGVPVVNSQADFDKLPKGTVYMEDGHQFKKP